MSTPLSKAHPSRKYTRRTEAQWRELIDGYEQSDLTLDEYCRQNKIATSGFYKWRKRFHSEAPVHAGEGRMIEITPHLQSPTPSTAPHPGLHVELELGHGCVLRIRDM